MELVSFVKEVAQNLAERAASCRLGQNALRQCDRVLWVIEKSARWAVPPPLDQEERPQPELIRPLPWVFFLALLLALRVTRESISLINLAFGKPPLRSADVVMFIQSKRRYLRTLKYQGNRKIRARGTPPQRESWYSRLQSLFEFTMCFRRQSHNYGNNNTTSISNNDEVLVVKRNKRTHDGQATNSGSPATETSMERLIEKMMVDLDAESDEDSSFTLTNATSVSINSDSEQEIVENHNESSPKSSEGEENVRTDDNVAPTNSEVTTPTVVLDDESKTNTNENTSTEVKESPTEVLEKESTPNATENNVEDKPATEVEHKDTKSEENTKENVKKDLTNSEDAPPKSPKKVSSKEESQNFLQNERCSPKGQRSPRSTKVGVQTQRQSSLPVARPSPPENTM